MSFDLGRVYESFIGVFILVVFGLLIYMRMFGKQLGDVMRELKGVKK